MYKAAIKSRVTLHLPVCRMQKPVSHLPSGFHHVARPSFALARSVSAQGASPATSPTHARSQSISIQALSLFLMAFLARLDRLEKLNQQDLEALPDRSPSPIADPDSTGHDTAGGVLLEPTASHVPGNKQTASNGADACIKAPPAETPDRRFVWVKDAESPFNPNLDAMQLKTTPPPPFGTTKLPAIDLQRGDLASARNHYTPIQALAKYPYKYCSKSHMQDIASAFFDKGKFWEREWDL